jgi:putative inorganic carbon (HCO3(-)) transporter
MSLLLILEAGLCALIVLAPLPFGSVPPAGRLMLELLALALTAIWIFAATRGTVALPPRSARVALIGLLVIAALQAIPLGATAVSALSPRVAALHGGLDPVPDPTLSMAPDATASALRTGAALVGILFVATSVVAARGARRLAIAALAVAAFQGLYGLLVLASGHDRIWSVPKIAYLDSATGTFVNHNHFAGFLAATLPLGVGVTIAIARRAQRGARAKGGLIAALGPDGSKALLFGLGALTGVAGLLLSFSRAGTALGLVAIAGTAAVVLRGRPVRRFAAIAIVVVIAAIPLVDIGADRLFARFAIAGDDYRGSGGRLDVARDTLRMIAAFPAAGCGFGAFTWAYPAFSSPQVRLHYTHAHNDLLQLGAEGGLASIALLAVVLVAVARSGARALRTGSDPVVTGAAFGLGALLVHGLVDFNFHIPANAAIAAVLAGILFGASWNGRS